MVVLSAESIELEGSRSSEPHTPAVDDRIVSQPCAHAVAKALIAVWRIDQP